MARKYDISDADVELPRLRTEELMEVLFDILMEHIPRPPLSVAEVRNRVWNKAPEHIRDRVPEPPVIPGPP